MARLVRKRLRQHNRQVVVFSMLSAAGAAICWGAFYFICKSLSLVMLAIVFGPYSTTPRGFAAGFVAVAIALVFSAWLDRRVTPNQLPRDEKSWTEIAMDFVLAVPRMTLAITGNLSAWQSLAQHEVNAGAYLLERVSEVKRMPMHETPLEIPERESRENVIEALLLLGLLELQRDEKGIWLRLPGSLRDAFRLPVLE